MRYVRRGWSKTCGVYLITNKINGKRYVGSSFNVSSRVAQHFGNVAKKYNNKHPFYTDICKYGRDNFEVKLLEKCPREEKISREQYWYKKLKPEYNLIFPDDQPFKNEIVRERALKAMMKDEVRAKMNESHRSEHCRKACRATRKPNMVACIGINKNGDKTPTFECMSDAARWLNRKATIPSMIAHIKQSIDGERNTAYGYRWEVVNNYENNS